MKENMCRGSAFPSCDPSCHGDSTGPTAPHPPTKRHALRQAQSQAKGTNSRGQIYLGEVKCVQLSCAVTCAADCGVRLHVVCGYMWCAVDVVCGCMWCSW